MKKQLKKIIFLGFKLDVLVEAAKQNSVDWEVVYDHTFGDYQGSAMIAMRVRLLAEDADLVFPDYYDPDTTYEEDVLAYQKALHEFMVQAKNELGQIWLKEYLF